MSQWKAGKFPVVVNFHFDIFLEISEVNFKVWVEKSLKVYVGKYFCQFVVNQV